jgi:hypothetical protein
MAKPKGIIFRKRYQNDKQSIDFSEDLQIFAGAILLYENGTRMASKVSIFPNDQVFGAYCLKTVPEWQVRGVLSKSWRGLFLRKRYQNDKRQILVFRE